MLKRSKKILTDQEGQGLAEYALILALVALAAVVALENLGDTIYKKIDEFASSYP